MSETISLRGQIIEFRRPWVMGILNVTPDSFYSGSRTPSAAEALMRARVMLAEGADILDIGACSTRPGSEPVSADEELERLMPALTAIREHFPEAVISVDTFRARVAEECLKSGKADIINDVSGGEDPAMFDVVSRHGAIYILMHSRGNPNNMDSLCNYGDVTADVVSELAFSLDEARKAGICNVIIDPGFGFAKTTRQNLQLLVNLDRLKVLECPILAGLSRKRFVRESGECELADSLTPTIALNSAALLKGASIIRVHDVREAVLTAKTIGKLWNSE